MPAHLRLASIDGAAVPPPPQPVAVRAKAARWKAVRAGESHGCGADHSTFRAMVKGLPASGLESVMRGLLASVDIVEEERLRRVRPLTSEAVRAARPVPLRARSERSAPSGQGTMGFAPPMDGEGRPLCRKRAARAIVAADAELKAGELLTSEAGTPLAYKHSGVVWTISMADAARRGVPELGGRAVRYAWGRPLPAGDGGVPF